MRIYFIRFMLFQSRMELALAILGGNRQRISQARQDEIHWEAELDREMLLGLYCDYFNESSAR